MFGLDFRWLLELRLIFGETRFFLGYLLSPVVLLLISILVWATLLGFVGRIIKYLISLTKVNASLTKKKNEIRIKWFYFLQYVYLDRNFLTDGKHICTKGFDSQLFVLLSKEKARIATVTIIMNSIDPIPQVFLKRFFY